MNWFKERAKQDNGFFIYLIVLTILVSSVTTSIVLNINNPSGVGGFVYKEIQWAEQTYNIVESNCRSLNGMNIPILYYDDDVKQFYCYNNVDCNKNGCRTKKVLIPIIVN